MINLVKNLRCLFLLSLNEKDDPMKNMQKVLIAGLSLFITTESNAMFLISGIYDMDELVEKKDTTEQEVLSQKIQHQKPNLEEIIKNRRLEGVGRALSLLPSNLLGLDLGLESVGLILERDIKNVIRNGKIDPELMYASYNKYSCLGIIKVLVECGFDVDLADEHGNTPLINAVIQNNLPAVIVFMEAGADCWLSNKMGKRPLEIARIMRNTDPKIIEVLEQAEDDYLEVWHKTA